MKFQAPKKLIPDDYPKEFRDFATKLFTDLNQFMQNVATILTQGIVITDNVKALKFNASIQVSQTFPMYQDVSALKERPSALIIGQLLRKDSTTITDNFALHWTYAEGKVSYTITGLNSTKEYTATLIALV